MPEVIDTDLSGNHKPQGPPVGPAPDPFDPASLRLGAGFTCTARKAILTVPVRKPGKTDFVRTHPSPEHRLTTLLLEVEGDRGRELYLVAPHLRQALAGWAGLRPKLLVTAVNRQGVIFLWEANLPEEGTSRGRAWSDSALQAIDRAAKAWVRVAANMSLGAYELFEAAGQLGEPEWPDLPFKELLRLAFKDRFIDSLDHPELRRLRGEL
jgi:hypothetical protein